MAGNATLDVAAKWLTVVGALNWGVAGVGGLLKNDKLKSGVVAIRRCRKWPC